MEQMRQTFQTTKSIQVLGKTDFRVPEMYNRFFDELGTCFSFVLARFYLPFIVSSRVCKKTKASIPEPLETPSPYKILLFFHAVHFLTRCETNKT